MDRSQGQCVSGKRPPGREKNASREGAARRHHASARLSQRLRERSRQRDRYGGDSRREHPHGRGSAGRRRRSLLGSDCRALWLESHGRERSRRSDLPLHDGRLGRSDSHGSVLALRHAEPDRAQGSLRHRLRLRHRPRPARDRHPQRGLAAAQPLPFGRHLLPLPASAEVEQVRRRSARRWSAAR